MLKMTKMAKKRRGNINWALKKIRDGKQKLFFGCQNKLFGPLIKLFGSYVLQSI